MRYAISNIAWGPEEDGGALAYLREWGIDGLEIAPTRLWPGWEGAGPAAAGQQRAKIEEAGLSCSALQAVLFGRPDLRLFGSIEQQRALEEHLAFVSEIAAELGARVVVFGSPANRLRGELPADVAASRAAELLRRVGERFAKSGVALGIEANPSAYGCDFVTHLRMARDLVHQIDSPGVVLHADAGGMLLNGEDPGDLAEAAPELEYFHASEPFLAPINGQSGQLPLARALSAGGYDGWCSIEMKRPGPGLDHVGAAIAAVRATYGRAAVT